MNGQRVIAGKVNVGVGPDFSRAEIRLFPVDGSSTRVVADRNLDPDSPFSAFDNSLAINDQGAVALGVRLFAGSIRAVYRFHGSEAVEIARAGAGPILDIDFFPPAISEDGLVAFRARDAHGQAVYVVGPAKSPRTLCHKALGVLAELRSSHKLMCTPPKPESFRA
jgi:hypothetical protein